MNVLMKGFKKNNSIRQLEIRKTMFDTNCVQAIANGLKERKGNIQELSLESKNYTKITF
jgi:hypothetical protein